MQGWVRLRPLASPKFGSRSRCPQPIASRSLSSRYQKHQKNEDDADDLSDETSGPNAFDHGDPFAEFRRDERLIRKIPNRGTREASDSNFDDGTWYIRSGETEQTLEPLPLPPFLWRDPVVRSNLTRRDYPGRYEPERPKLTTKKNLKRAEFSTHLAQNPYAAALARPVRACTFTHDRLPTSCLVDFRVVTNEESGTMNLLPWSIHAALEPKRKILNPPETEQEAVMEPATYDEGSIGPTGSATYMTCQKQALEYISEDRRKRLIRRGVSTRMKTKLTNGELQRLQWREDMAQYVLGKLRAIVLRKLRPLFVWKGANVENRGLMMALPGALSEEGAGPSGLASLDEVNDVMCVLKLTPTDKAKIIPRYNISGKNGKPSGPQKERPADEDMHGNSDANYKDESNVQSFDDKPAREPTDTQNHDFISSLTNGLDNSMINRTTLDTPSSAASDTRSTTNESKTYIAKTSWWTSKLPTFLAPITKPVQPAPGSPPSTLHFPTVPYRNRRIPLYQLHHMLGKDVMEKLVHNTAFSAKKKKDSGLELDGPERAGDIAAIDYVVLTRHMKTVQAQMWLMKLAGYVAKRKDEPF